MLTPVIGRKYVLTFKNSKEGEIEFKGEPLTGEFVCTHSDTYYLCFETETSDSGSTEGIEFFRHHNCGNPYHNDQWWTEELWSQLVSIEEVQL